MKFSELKLQLNRPSFLEETPAFVIEGEDAFLRESALNMIRKKADVPLPEWNEAFFSEEQSFADVLLACEVLPVLSKKRLVIGKDIKADAKSKSLWEDYLRQPVKETLLIFVNSSATEMPKWKGLTWIDCAGLDEVVIEKWIVNECRKAEKRIAWSDAKRLSEYCRQDMTRISTEVQKLCAIPAEEITQEWIETLVNKDAEYRVFELTNAIAAKNTAEAFAILKNLTERGEDPIFLMGTIYSSFRRMFYVIASDLSLKELSALLKVKEYAIVKARETAQGFRAVKLKRALDLCAEADENCKTGVWKAQTALNVLVMKLLNL